MASDPKQQSALVRVGNRVSAWASDQFAHPYMQIGIIVFCVTWFVLGLQTDLLTAALSILAITLTQMVLNSQIDREKDDHRRDVAMHAKLDELLIAMKGARNELTGIEDLEEDEIVELKDSLAHAIDEAGTAAGNVHERAAVKRAVNEVASARPSTKPAAIPAEPKRREP